MRWTGSHDFAESGVPDAVTPGDISALVAFQATSAAADRQDRTCPTIGACAAAEGAKQFDALGCAVCHMTTLPLKSLVFTDPAPYDMAGTLRASESEQGDPHRSVQDAVRQPAARGTTRANG